MEILNSMSLGERLDIVQRDLRPDEIRNHHVAHGLTLDVKEQAELSALAADVASYSSGMSEIARIAMDAPAGDKLMRNVRHLMGTEGLFQAILRGEVKQEVPGAPQLTKVDIVHTRKGFQIVEIEPGKIRGLGYGVMVRHQTTRPIGIGAAASLASITAGMETGILMSEKDRFHEPEMKILASVGDNLQVRPQFSFDENQRRNPVEGLLMMSPLVRMGMSEAEIREKIAVLSDRRLDLESKGCLAILHNLGEIDELDDLLLHTVGREPLERLRKLVPATGHILLDRDLLGKVIDSTDPIFLKPVLDSGTRGIVTPDDSEASKKATTNHKTFGKFVAQTAVETVKIQMDSVDVLNGHFSSGLMNLRITAHVDSTGNIVETTVVGSPHEHLAHGGKTSVITNLEAPNE